LRCEHVLLKGEKEARQTLRETSQASCRWKLSLPCLVSSVTCTTPRHAQTMNVCFADCLLAPGHCGLRACATTVASSCVTSLVVKTRPRRFCKERLDVRTCDFPGPAVGAHTLSQGLGLSKSHSQHLLRTPQSMKLIHLPNIDVFLFTPAAHKPQHGHASSLSAHTESSAMALCLV